MSIPAKTIETKPAKTIETGAMTSLQSGVLTLCATVQNHTPTLSLCLIEEPFKGKTFSKIFYMYEWLIIEFSQPQPVSLEHKLLLTADKQWYCLTAFDHFEIKALSKKCIFRANYL